MHTMKRYLQWGCAALMAFSALCPTLSASDHADPMSLDAFRQQDDPIANITDLHAFLVDKERKPILKPEQVKDADQLIVSLCVRRRLLPSQIQGVGRDLSKYTFRLHLDTNPEVRFFEEGKTRDGRDYNSVVSKLNSEIADLTKQRDGARKSAQGSGAPQSAVDELAELQKRLSAKLTERGFLVSRYQSDQGMQRLYGGIFTNPTAIAEEATLSFQLSYAEDGENSEASLKSSVVQGIAGRVNEVSTARKSLDGAKDISIERRPIADAINVQVGIFDDPFIFPRFFRSNVVGIVVSIPLKTLQRTDGSSIANGPVFLWATTHKPDGTQSDHVGRSLRTQLPRFGYLNELHPSQHVAAITKVHDAPDLMENVLSTFLSPLVAHRHYDSVPDVMVYDLRKPAKFPNGRWFEDDVAKSLADAGETLLFELSYAESTQVPRSTTNDKQFKTDFPYLADRWTTEESADFAAAGGVTTAGFAVPNAPDSAAIGLPNFVPAVWKSLWAGLAISLVLVAFLAVLAVRGLFKRFLLVLVLLVGLMTIHPIRADQLPTSNPMAMSQPARKLVLVLVGGGFIAAFGLLALYAFGIRRGISIAKRESVVPLGDQSVVDADRQYTGSKFNEVCDAVFSEPYYGSVWGESGSKPLPVYETRFVELAQGLCSLSKRFIFKDAATRTVASRADLRWGGPERKGVQRLLHPNGVCLSGEWNIHEDTEYTGFFSKGSKGLVIARYSTGLSVWRGKARTLSMVGKIYPTLDPTQQHIPASFITQEELGGSYTESIHGALLRNAPNVTPLNRGFGLGTLFLTLLAFARSDRSATVRQLYQVAELGKPSDTPTRCPRFMQLQIVSQKIGGDSDTNDFRDEVMAQIYDRGEQGPKRKLVFEIQVSDKGELKGLLNTRLEGADWRPIGTITFDRAAVSYNGDFVIHFNHPKWRADQNDPESVTGPTKLGRFLNRISDRIGTIADLFAKKS